MSPQGSSSTWLCATEIDPKTWCHVKPECFLGLSGFTLCRQKVFTDCQTYLWHLPLVGGDLYLWLPVGFFTVSLCECQFRIHSFLQAGSAVNTWKYSLGSVERSLVHLMYAKDSSTCRQRVEWLLKNRDYPLGDPCSQAYTQARMTVLQSCPPRWQLPMESKPMFTPLAEVNLYSHVRRNYRKPQCHITCLCIDRNASVFLLLVALNLMAILQRRSR